MSLWSSEPHIDVPFHPRTRSSLVLMPLSYHRITFCMYELLVKVKEERVIAIVHATSCLTVCGPLGTLGDLSWLFRYSWCITATSRHTFQPASICFWLRVRQREVWAVALLIQNMCYPVRTRWVECKLSDMSSLSPPRPPSPPPTRLWLPAGRLWEGTCQGKWVNLLFNCNFRHNPHLC